MFKNRNLLIATKHQKEKVIAPIFESELGVKCIVNNTFDTDTLGTFAGEYKRELDPILNAKEKCIRAMKEYNCDLAIASEGSFGPHPAIFFVSADDEFLILIDTKNNLEIIIREISTDTNFNAKEIKSTQELFEFAEKSGFPEHAIILRKSPKENIDIFKGITDYNYLEKIFRNLYGKYNTVYAETDMRAMYNPKRMEVIKKATEKLVERIKSICPNCEKPGFGVTEIVKGLKCKLCGSPTNSTLSYLHSCNHCSFTKEELFPNNKTKEDPMFCDNCNP
jgi:hypothetical protein